MGKNIVSWGWRGLYLRHWRMDSPWWHASVHWKCIHCRSIIPSSFLYWRFCVAPSRPPQTCNCLFMHITFGSGFNQPSINWTIAVTGGELRESDYAEIHHLSLPLIPIWTTRHRQTDFNRRQQNQFWFRRCSSFFRLELPTKFPCNPVVVNPLFLWFRHVLPVSQWFSELQNSI